MNKVSGTSSSTRSAVVFFDSGAPITLIPLDASNHVPLNPPFYDRVQQHHTTPQAAFIYQTLTADISIVQSGTFFIWDPLAAAVLTDPGLAFGKTLTLRVVQELDEESDHPGQLVEDPNRASIDVMLEADADGFYDLITIAA